MPGDDVLNEIRQKLKDRPAKILLWESAPTNEIAAKLSSELGLRSIVFSPCETLDAASVAAGQDYLTVMKANIARLAEGIKPQ
jgi:zinc transport system substrate-binding protein